MRTARRYAATVEDAEDAYQRAIEIMLTKAPDIPDAELLPWLKTVVRHEAFAIRRRGERVALGLQESFDGDGVPDDAVVASPPTPGEQAERFERLRLGAEALKGLKPQEARALSLLAQGYSYRQISETTGWTYTKVNRCLAEGRQGFVERVASIESGGECSRLEPKLSAFADGEAPAADVAELRRHLSGCGACQAVLREHHLAPSVVGALMPVSVPDSVVWLVERFAGLADALKVKLTALVRSSGVDPATVSEVAASGGSRGVASAAVAKGLALLCVGGVGVGGVASGVDHFLHRADSETARAAGERGRSATKVRGLDAKVAAERLRGATKLFRGHPSPLPNTDIPHLGRAGDGLGRPVPGGLGSEPPGSRRHRPPSPAPMVGDFGQHDVWLPTSRNRTRRGDYGADGGDQANEREQSRQSPTPYDTPYGDGVPGSDTPYGEGVPGYDTSYGEGVPATTQRDERVGPSTSQG